MIRRHKIWWFIMFQLTHAQPPRAVYLAVFSPPSCNWDSWFTTFFLAAIKCLPHLFYNEAFCLRVVLLHSCKSVLSRCPKDCKFHGIPVTSRQKVKKIWHSPGTCHLEWLGWWIGNRKATGWLRGYSQLAHMWCELTVAIGFYYPRAKSIKSPLS